jgi:transcriptional regulator with XRE-family HTH domain
MSYNEKLRELREDRDLTQKDVAELLHTDQSYYAKYENGKRPLPLNHLITLCAFYKVSSDYILELPKGLKWPR